MTKLGWYGGDLSRNRTVGLRLGRGEKLGDIKKSMVAVAEGVLTSKAAFELSQKLQIDCPIIEGIYKVIHGEQHALNNTQQNAFPSVFSGCRSRSDVGRRDDPSIETRDRSFFTGRGGCARPLTQISNTCLSHSHLKDWVSKSCLFFSARDADQHRELALCALNDGTGSASVSFSDSLPCSSAAQPGGCSGESHLCLYQTS